jgi:hypothetical protein
MALSADGNTLAAGAIGEDSMAAGINNLAFQNDDSAASSGAVYVFTRTGSTWSQQAYVKASNAGGGDLFGYSVGVSGDGNTLAVGAFDEDGSARTVNATPDNLRTGSGAAYAFERTGNAWRQTAYLKGSRSSVNDSLGGSLTISGDGNTIAVGTTEENCLVPGVNPSGCDVDATPPNFGMSFSAGAVYVWGRSGNTWTEQAFIKSSNPNLYDLFGARATLSGDGNTLAVSAQREDGGTRGFNGNQADNTILESGAAYLFTRSGATWTQQVYVKASNTEENHEFGSAIALSGDGKFLAVGARGEASAAKGVNGNQNDNSVPESGAAYVFAVN